MSLASGIEWTDATWNPVRGCSRVSQGCVNCYAERIAARFSGPGQPYEGLARRVGDVIKLGGHPAHDRIAVRPSWTGEVRMVEEHLADPLRWRKPRMIFVNSMSDLFHERLPDDAIDQVFAVMALTPRHTYQVLTKRPGRMRLWFASNSGGFGRLDDVRSEAYNLGGEKRNGMLRFSDAEVLAAVKSWPLPNVWLGVSVEDQATADERIPFLLETPATVRFLSAEPLLGPIDLKPRTRPDLCIRCGEGSGAPHNHPDGYRTRGLDWVIVGGESGPGARPMEASWARSIRDQCTTANLPFFFKQWGGRRKKEAGRLLDGRTWNEMPRLSL